MSKTQPLALLPSVATKRRPASAFSPLNWLRSRLGSMARRAKSLNLEHESLTHGASVQHAPAVGRGQALRRAHRALQYLFQHQEGLRQVLPHLSLLERALARKGSKALRQLPAQVLQSALEQLEDLQTSENHPDLAVLRTRMVETLALRSVSALPDTGHSTTL